MAKIKIDTDRCKGCGLCVIYCPSHSIIIDEGLSKRGVRAARIKTEDGCSGCTLCAIICPDCAIEVYK